MFVYLFQFYYETILPGNSKSLWDAVNVAHDYGIDSLPNIMSLDGRRVQGYERSESFATFFDCKVKQVTDSTIVDPQVYNGTRKIFAGEIIVEIVHTKRYKCHSILVEWSGD